MKDELLIVGGTGTVGRRLAAQLAPDFPGRVVVAARDGARAAALCKEIGHGARARHVDAEDEASVARALEDATTVIACVAQRGLHVLRASIARGLAYTDIAPRLAFWELADAMAADARRSGARVVLGAGLSPGISNLMARRLADELGGVQRIQTAILLSLGDEYGPDSMDHVLEAVAKPFTVLEDGRRREALPFTEGERVSFPGSIGERTAFLFPWSDVVYYPKTLGARTAIGRFALDPPWAAWLAALAVRAGAPAWLRRPGGSGGMRRIVERVRTRSRERDRFAVMVTAANGHRTRTMALAGRKQAAATADGAAAVVRALARGEVSEAGVWLPEQVISCERFFEALASAGWHPVVVDEESRGSRHARCSSDGRHEHSF